MPAAGADIGWMCGPEAARTQGAAAGGRRESAVPVSMQRKYRSARFAPGCPDRAVDAAGFAVRFTGGCLLVAALIWLAGCGRAAQPQPARTTLADVRIAGGWCQAYNVGYVAGVSVGSKALFEALCPPVHELASLSDVHCPSCRAAIAGDGFCGHCGVGWVGQRCYVNKLSYCLARGNPLDVSALACPACREHARRYGWCDHCRIGMLGAVAFRDRRLYDEAVPSFEILLASVAKLRECETCAVAMSCDGTCPVHGVSYKGGQVVHADAPGPPGRPAGSS